MNEIDACQHNSTKNGVEGMGCVCVGDGVVVHLAAHLCRLLLLLPSLGKMWLMLVAGGSVLGVLTAVTLIAIIIINVVKR